MNLKEAFRYQNYLENLLNNVNSYLTSRENVVQIKEIHYRHKSNIEAEDETKDVTANRIFPNYKVKQIIDFMMTVANEKCKLTAAIDEAKKAYKDTAYDVELINNRTRQTVARVLRYLNGLKSTETAGIGRDYKFNVNGDQVSYAYETKIVQTIDYDRNNVRKLFQQCSEESDAVSTKLDQALLNITVVMEPKFNVNYSFEEAVEQYLGE